MPVSDYYEALIFEDGKKINVSRKINMQLNGQIHWHPYAELVLSLSELNTTMVNFNSHDLKINDIVVVYPGELHSVLSSGEDSFLIVQFPIELLSAMGELSPMISGFPRRHYVRYDPTRLECEDMVLHIKKIVSLYFSDRPFRETRMYAQMLDFFAQLGEYLLDDEDGEIMEAAGKEQESLRLMAEACLYITDNCARPITLDSVAHYVGISKSHFSHLFKLYTNMTFVDYLTNERIRKAEGLSLDPSMTVTDITFEAGFSSISTFNRAFRKVKGVTPTEFREKMVN